MKKLKVKHNYKNFFNIGNVLKIYYIVFFKKKKRIYSFIGFCFFKNKNNFKLINIIKKQKIVITFDFASPFILKIFNLKMYNTLIKRVSKLYFKVNAKYIDDYKNLKNRIVSNYSSFKVNFFKSCFFKKELTYKKIKKLRSKYMRGEKWYDLSGYDFEHLNIFSMPNILYDFDSHSVINTFEFEKRYYIVLNSYIFNESQFFILSDYYSFKSFFFKFKNLDNQIDVFSQENEIFDLLNEHYDDVYDEEFLGNRIFAKNTKNFGWVSWKI